MRKDGGKIVSINDVAVMRRFGTMNQDVIEVIWVEEVEHIVACSRTRRAIVSRVQRRSTTETDPRSQARDRPDVAVIPHTDHYDSPPVAGSDCYTDET